MSNPKRPILLWSSLAALSASAVLASGVAHRVADLRTGVSSTRILESGQFGSAGGLALLAFDTPGFGREPWTSDGSTAGTRLLRNVAAGSDSALPVMLGEVAGGRALFSALTLESGRELWTTDGTAAGTAPLAEFVPGIRGTEMRALGRLGAAQLLAVARQQGSLEVWRSDGTEAGTWLVRKIQQTPLPYSLTNAPVDSALYGGELYFAVADAATGVELWASDGTDGGTRRVADIRAGAEGSVPHDLVGDGSRLGFNIQQDAPNWGTDAWILDASSPLPRPIPLPVARIQAAVLGRVPGGLVVWSRGGGVARIWFSDGTPGGAVELRQLASEFLDDRRAVQVGDRVVFWDSTPETGGELWVTDGTPTGTFLLGDLVPGSASSFASRMLAGHDGSYFCESIGGELWRTDGTPAGTGVVATPAAECEYLLGSAVLPGVTLIDVCHTVLVPPHDEEERCETYRTDGSSTGTSPLRGPLSRSPSDPERLTARAGGLVFRAWPDSAAAPGSGPRGVATDGSEAGTVELTLAGGGPVVVNGALEALPDGTILLSDFNDDTGRLSRVDGAEIVPIFSAPEASIDWLEPTGDLSYFAVWEAAAGQELWTSDGTSLGTGRVRDIEPGPEGSYPSWLTDVFGTSFFLATTSAHGTELWQSDGTLAGTLPHDIVAGPDSTFVNPRQPAPFREDLGLLTLESEAGLHVVDPVVGQQTLLQPVTDGGGFGVSTSGSGPATRLFYWIYQEGDGCVLRSSDGTPADVVRLPDMAPASSTWDSTLECHDEVVAAGALAYYVSCDVAAGCELWSTDGSVAGTERFADFEAGIASSVPRGLTVIGDRLYFALCRQATGCEPWISDFTAAGTHPLGDIAPGPASSDPRGFTRSDPWIYFAADDGTGSELWAVPIEIFYDGFQTGDSSRWSAP